MRSSILALLALITAQSGHAATVKSQYTAPNGVVIDVQADDFAGRKEYSSPFVEFQSDGEGGHGKAIVGEVFDNGKLLGMTVQGYIFYSGDWRFYSTAIFRGGQAANFHRTGSDVVDCHYGCTMSENFLIDITPAEARAHATGGIVGIQVRGTSSHTALLNIPLSYFEAVASLAGDPGETAAPASTSPPTASKAVVVPKPTAKKPSQPARKKAAVTCVTCG